MNTKTVLITGISGLVGKQLAKQLKSKGYYVIGLSTSPSKKTDLKTYYWNYEKLEIDTEPLLAADYIIHLAGAGIADKPWTTERKKLIQESRTRTTSLLFKSLQQLNKKPLAIIAASAIGYYGAVTSSTIFDEEGRPATDFLGETCRLWEESVKPFQKEGIRTVILRTGIVLSAEGGALPKMVTPIKLGLGSALGSGKQYQPWIHINDLCDAYIYAIENETMQGIYNAVAPQHITNSEFTRQIATILNKSLWMPSVPSFAMTLLFGEMAQLLLTGSRVSAQKIQTSKFKFGFPELNSALFDLLKNR